MAIEKGSRVRVRGTREKGAVEQMRWSWGYRTTAVLVRLDSDNLLHGYRISQLEILEEKKGVMESKILVPQK